MLDTELSKYGTDNNTLREVDQKCLEMFFNVMLERERKDQLDRLCEKLRNAARDQEGKGHPVYN